MQCYAAPPTHWSPMSLACDLLRQHLRKGKVACPRRVRLLYPIRNWLREAPSPRTILQQAPSTAGARLSHLTPGWSDAPALLARAHQLKQAFLGHSHVSAALAGTSYRRSKLLPFRKTVYSVFGNYEVIDQREIDDLENGHEFTSIEDIAPTWTTIARRVVVSKKHSSSLTIKRTVYQGTNA